MRYEDRCDKYDYCLAMVNLKFTAAEETGKGVRGKCRLKRVMRGGVASREEGGGEAAAQLLCERATRVD
jgi:hypothetical protein